MGYCYGRGGFLVDGTGYCGVGGYSGSAEVEAIHCFDYFTAGPPRNDDGEMPEQTSMQTLSSDVTAISVTPSFPENTSVASDIDSLTLPQLSGPFTVVDAPELPYTIALQGESLVLHLAFSPEKPGEHVTGW